MNGNSKKPETIPETKNILPVEEPRGYLPDRKQSLPPVLPSKRSPGTAYLMLDKLRSSTNSSHFQCVVAFMKMMNVLAQSDPQLANLSKELIDEVVVCRH